MMWKKRPRQSQREENGPKQQHVKPCYTNPRATINPMKSNITLKLDTDLIRQVRILAAEQGTSISALLSSRLESIVRERKAFDQARKRALARLNEGYDLHWKRPRTRDELHER